MEAMVIIKIIYDTDRLTLPEITNFLTSQEGIDNIEVLKEE